jgi:hypothetical protein
MINNHLNKHINKIKTCNEGFTDSITSEEKEEYIHLRPKTIKTYLKEAAESANKEIEVFPDDNGDLQYCVYLHFDCGNIVEIKNNEETRYGRIINSTEYLKLLDEQEDNNNLKNQNGETDFTLKVSKVSQGWEIQDTYDIEWIPPFDVDSHEINKYKAFTTQDPINLCSKICDYCPVRFKCYTAKITA